MAQDFVQRAVTFVGHGDRLDEAINRAVSKYNEWLPDHYVSQYSGGLAHTVTPIVHQDHNKTYHAVLLAVGMFRDDVYTGKTERLG